MRRGLVAIAVAVALYGTMLAGAANALERVVKWKVFPAPKVLTSGAADEDALASHRARLSVHAQYAELYDRQGRPHACVTFDADKQSTAVLVYYSPTGQSTLFSLGLEPPANQHTTLTFLAPQGDGNGLTLLSLWDQPPAQAELTQLMLDGDTGDAAGGNTSYYQWFARQQPAWRNPPWLGAIRRPDEPPQGIMHTDWPAFYAEALPDQTIRAKDCALLFRGLTGFDLDRDGSYGYWRLSWDVPLKLRFDLAGPALPGQARLVVYAQADGTFTWSGLPAFDIKVNSWGQAPLAIPAIQYSATQPIAIDVSQNLSLGLNTIEVGVSAFSNVGWRVRRVELWTE